MTEVYISYSIQKEFKKNQKLLREILKEIQKHTYGTNNLINIYSLGGNLKILKAYLDSKKIRAAILLKVTEKIYIPFLIAKKESKKGWNLSKYSEDLLLKKIQKIRNEIATKKTLKYKLNSNTWIVS